MNEFRGSRPPMMTADELMEKRRRAELNKVDPQADTHLEDRLGITTDEEIDAYLDIEGEHADAQGGSNIVGLHRASRTEVPKKVERKFKHGGEHRGDDKPNAGIRVAPPHKQDRTSM